MSSSEIIINGATVSVKAFPHIDLERCKNAPIFKDWMKNVDPEIRIESVLFSDVKYFGPRVGFLMIETISKFNGVAIPGICFLRGGAVSILVLLHCEGETHVLLTRQARVPVGHSGLLELPAGMLDDSGAFAGVAAKELREETGLVLTAADLTDLSARALESGGEEAAKLRSKSSVPRGVYPSPGGCDEFIRFMFHERTVTREELDAMRGKATGLREEGEVIVLEIVPYNLAHTVCSDAKLLSSMLLYERLRV